MKDEIEVVPPDKEATRGHGQPKDAVVRKGRLPGWVSISAAAFLMSATATGINIYYAAQGAEITIQPPTHVLLYRDGEGDNSVLSVAIRFVAINTSSNYGDLILKTATSTGDLSRSFPQEGLAKPVFTGKAEAAAANCSLGQSCVGVNGLMVMQDSEEIMDLPGGSAKSFTPYYWLLAQDCDDGDTECSRWANFNTAKAELARENPVFQIDVKFQEDGERSIMCETRQIDVDYLSEIGWTQIPCVSSSVEGAPWL